MSDIRTELQHIRAKKGMTYEQIAFKSGCSCSNVYRILNGQGANLSTIEEIAAALGCELVVKEISTC